MAHLTYARAPMAEFGGNQHQGRKLMHDTTAGFRHSDQRPTPQVTTPGSSHQTGGRGGEQSANEETTNEDDAEDSSTAKDDEQEGDDDEPEVAAPSYGFGKGGKGKGKRPAIRIEPVDNDNESQGEDDETLSHAAGLIPSKHPVNQLLMNNKKRTFSNLSSTSVLFGDDSTDQESFPRRKMARKLSNVASEPLLTYKESDDDTHVKHYENAIESDDEDYSGVNLVPDDDDDDMDLQEESYILQEEQQATTLLNEFRDARRLSLDSCASDNIFGVTAPLNEAFISSLPDFGFAQFFEPEALPESPDPAVKRKYSDSSTKRVRFDDEVQVSDSSSSESSELDSSVFPDLFLEQDKLPPVLHQLLEMENDDDNEDMDSPVSDASFWDYGQDESRITQADHSDDTDGDSSAGSSGYDSDMGDTTDEEDFGPEVPPRTPVQKQSVLRRPNSAPGSRAATPNPFQRSSRPTGRQIPPTRGVFIHDDSTKAIAVTNRATKTVTFYRPRATLIPWIPLNGYHSSTSSTANNSPRTSIAQLNGSDSEVSNEVFNNALGTDIMLTGIFGSAPGNDYFFGNDSVGPPEAFFPFVSIGSNGNMNIMDEDEYDDSEDYEDDLNITDFMDFGSEGDDTDLEQEEEETDVPATPATTKMAPPSSTPAQPTPMTETPSNRKRTTSDVMLEHFDRGVVTAFRNNQNRYRDVSSLPQDPAVRASVSRPVRSGKSAEALITPLRKRSRAKRMARSPLHAGATIGNHSSPLSGVSKAASRLQNSVMSPPRGPPPRMGTFS
ncbi:Nn.00g089090.m01.CDS01 [Neocucurbitaria sp. VM-36]